MWLRWHYVLIAAHFFRVKAGLGGGSDSYAELLSLKLLIDLFSKKGLFKLQIFGDSLVALVVINWMKGEFRMGNLVLILIFGIHASSL